jgi:hypothetical protein
MRSLPSPRVKTRQALWALRNTGSVPDAPSKDEAATGAGAAAKPARLRRLAQRAADKRMMALFDDQAAAPEALARGQVRL